jgi:hypothetical protein
MKTCSNSLEDNQKMNSRFLNKSILIGCRDLKRSNNKTQLKIKIGFKTNVLTNTTLLPNPTRYDKL